MYKVLLGGELSSGKSTVASELSSLGAHVIDLDDIAASVRSIPEVSSKLAARFGDDILDETGIPVASILASRAFSSAEATEDLDDICHPYILSEMESTMHDCESIFASDEVLVVEASLLSKMKSQIPLFDEVLYVVAPFGKRLERSMQRGMPNEDLEKRMARQNIEDMSSSIADTLFFNNGDLSHLKIQVDRWWKIDRANSENGSH